MLKRLTFVLLLTLIGCAPAGKLSTPSGRPEVTVRGASLQQLKTLCASVMMRDGYSVEGNTGYALQLVKREESTFLQPIGDIHEATFNFGELGSTITIYFREREIIYPQTPSQRINEKNTQPELEEQQRRLEMIAAEARRINPDPGVQGGSKL